MSPLADKPLSAQRKLLVLAIDAANRDLLRQWAGEGILPNIASLLSGSLQADCRSVEGLYIGGSWPSFYTGTTPAAHGFYYVDPLRPGTYERRQTRPAELGLRPALWEVLSGAGRRVVVLDVPLTRLSPGLNGVQVVEWGVHDAVFGFRASPRGLKREILDHVGLHPAPTNCDAEQRTLSEYEAFADQLCRGAAARARLTTHALATRPWDFAIQVFSEAHCAGHQLWHFHDPAHPGFASRGGEDLVRRVYVAIDRAIGEIVSAVSPSVTVALVVLHGMSHQCGATLLLPEILVRLGAAAPPPGPAAGSIKGQAAQIGRSTSSYYRRLPEGLRRPIYDLRQSVRRWLFGRRSHAPIDPRRTRAFHVMLGSPTSGIRFNQIGREPLGQLAPGRETEEFCAELIRELEALRDPETGRPTVGRIRRTKDLFSGPCVDSLPDLVIDWNTDRPLGTTATGRPEGATVRACSDRVGLVERTNISCRTGEHRIEGMVAVRGPGISAGHLGRTVSILDLAPTFALALGCTMPGVDGSAISEFLPTA